MTDVRTLFLEVQQECKEIALKIEKLRQFPVAPDSKNVWIFNSGVTFEDPCLLKQQYVAMVGYKKALEARLLAMSKEINSRSKKKAKK